jgi:REP element-mobilizing transposase RayT
MPREPRLAIPNGVYHVTNRGVDRDPIVRRDADRWDWLRQLDTVALRCQWRVFAYALMDNHFHLFLRTPQPNLSSGMRDFEGAFAAAFNRRHERVGPMFQGRFHGVLVESDSHLWEVSRYVHLNPFRAGLTRQPACYAWCSYRFYLNPRGAPAWLDWQTVLAELGRTEAAARVGYKRFVEAGMASRIPNPLAAAKEGLVLGREEFVARVLEQTSPSRAEAEWPRLARLRRTPTADEIVDHVGIALASREARSRTRCGGSVSGSSARPISANVWTACGRSSPERRDAKGVGGTNFGFRGPHVSSVW